MAQSPMNSLPVFSSLCGAVPPAAAAAAESSLACLTCRKKSQISSFSATTAPQDPVADAHTVRMCSEALRTRIRVPGAQHRAVMACQTKGMSGFHDEDASSSAPHGHSRGGRDPETTEEVLTIISKMQSKVVSIPTNSSNSSTNPSLRETISSLRVFPMLNLPEQNSIPTNFQLTLC